MQKIKTHFRKRLESHMLCYLSFLAHSLFDLKKANGKLRSHQYAAVDRGRKSLHFQAVRKE